MRLPPSKKFVDVLYLLHRKRMTGNRHTAGRSLLCPWGGREIPVFGCKHLRRIAEAEAKGCSTLHSDGIPPPRKFIFSSIPKHSPKEVEAGRNRTWRLLPFRLQLTQLQARSFGHCLGNARPLPSQRSPVEDLRARSIFIQAKSGLDPFAHRTRG